MAKCDKDLMEATQQEINEAISMKENDKYRFVKVFTNKIKYVMSFDSKDEEPLEIEFSDEAGIIYRLGMSVGWMRKQQELIKQHGADQCCQVFRIHKENLNKFSKTNTF